MCISEFFTVLTCREGYKKPLLQKIEEVVVILNRSSSYLPDQIICRIWHL